MGCGNRGGNLLESFLRIGENVVALCDVNQQRAAKTFQKAPDVPKHLDYRKMLEENGLRSMQSSWPPPIIIMRPVQRWP